MQREEIWVGIDLEETSSTIWVVMHLEETSSTICTCPVDMYMGTT